MLNLILLFCVFGLTTCRISSKYTLGDPLKNLKAGTGTLYHNTAKLDNFNDTDTRFWSQRYWVNDNLYDNTTGMVLLYICGEWTCSPQSEESAVGEYAKQTKSKIISLEHRYYGDSQPFTNAEGGWSTENLKWLNTSQALADTSAFIKNYKDQNKATATQKWVIIGGSYPGAFVAWFKSQYPNDVDAAWSSSGVINSIQDFTAYDEDIYTSTSKSNLKCSQIIEMMTIDAERILTGGDAVQRESFLSDFDDLSNNVTVNRNISNVDFMQFFADIWSGAIQNGQRTETCAILMNNTYENLEWKGMADWTRKNGAYPSDDDSDRYGNVTINPMSADRQWHYQFCTMFGWFQTANKLYPERSLLLNNDYFLRECFMDFGDEQIKPDPEWVNYNYGGLNIQGDNIIFATASEDPWQGAQMTKIHDPSTQVNMIAIHIVCNDCSHCVDLHGSKTTDSNALSQGRHEIMTYLNRWLQPKTEKTQFLQN